MSEVYLFQVYSKYTCMENPYEVYLLGSILQVYFLSDETGIVYLKYTFVKYLKV